MQEVVMHANLRLARIGYSAHPVNGRALDEVLVMNANYRLSQRTSTLKAGPSHPMCYRVGPGPHRCGLPQS